jgi:hypothetical protein
MRMDPLDPEAARAAAADVAVFSRIVLARPLRPYQADIAHAVVTAALGGHGHTFSVLMARQMGKNELSAHIEAYLTHCAR